MAGWAISIGFGLAAGVIIGIVYKLLNDSFDQTHDFFNDATLYEYPKPAEQKEKERRGQPEPYVQ